MEDCKSQVIMRIISDMNEQFAFPAAGVRDILERNLQDYVIERMSAEKALSDLTEKIQYFINVKRLDGLAATTLKNYEEELIRFSKQIQKPAVAITATDIRQYLAQQQSGKTLKKTTMNNKIGAIRSFFSFLAEEEIIIKDPTSKVKSLKVDKNALRHSLAIEELEELRNTCQDNRDKAIVEFLVSTGCRLSEAIGVKVSEINWTECSVMVHGKGDKYRKVFFTAKCKIYLKHYLGNRNGVSDRLFLSERMPYQPITDKGLYRVLSRLAARTSIKAAVSPHVLRHTFATLALQRGMPLEIIQHLLGHTSIATTQIYAKVNDRMIKADYDRYVAAG